MARIIGATEDKPKTPYIPPEMTPIADRVVVQSDVLPELTKGGIALPNSVVGKRASRMGTVIAVGPGAQRLLQEGRGPMQCKVGDRVILPQTLDRVQMDLDDEQSELVILPESHLMAILPERLTTWPSPAKKN